MASIPIRVARTYDSRRRHEALDFGYGWSIDYQDITIDETTEPSKGWDSYQQKMTFFINDSYVTLRGTCIKPTTTKRVTITLPTDEVEEFSVKAHNASGGAQALGDPDCYMVAGNVYDLEFIAENDTESTLTSSDAVGLYFNHGTGNMQPDLSEFIPAAINRYTLTTREGYIYSLDQDFGITQVKTPNGQTLTYNESGIHHSAGKSVHFQRDDQGRITQITDPSNQTVMAYSYNTAGDLTTASEALGDSSYRYNQTHGLIDILSGGQPLLKNIYDDQGRLIAQEDSNGVNLP